MVEGDTSSRVPDMSSDAFFFLLESCDFFDLASALLSETLHSYGALYGTLSGTLLFLSRDKVGNPPEIFFILSVC